MHENNSIQARAKFLENTSTRFYNALNYFTLFVYVLVISIAAMAVDYVLVLVLEFFFLNDIDKYPVVSQAFDWYKIGSAFLVFFVAMIHAIISSYSQIKFEVQNARNE